MFNDNPHKLNEQLRSIGLMAQLVVRHNVNVFKEASGCYDFQYDSTERVWGLRNDWKEIQMDHRTVRGSIGDLLIRTLDFRDATLLGANTLRSAIRNYKSKIRNRYGGAPV